MRMYTDYVCVLSHSSSRFSRRLCASAGDFFPLVSQQRHLLRRRCPPIHIDVGHLLRSLWIVIGSGQAAFSFVCVGWIKSEPSHTAER